MCVCCVCIYENFCRLYIFIFLVVQFSDVFLSLSLSLSLALYVYLFAHSHAHSSRCACFVCIFFFLVLALLTDICAFYTFFCCCFELKSWIRVKVCVAICYCAATEIRENKHAKSSNIANCYRILLRHCAYGNMATCGDFLGNGNWRATLMVRIAGAMVSIYLSGCPLYFC